MPQAKVQERRYTDRKPGLLEENKYNHFNAPMKHALMKKEDTYTNAGEMLPTNRCIGTDFSSD